MGKIGATDILKAGRELRLAHWRIQRETGIDIIPSNDFSLYDHVLDTTLMVGAIPKRYAQLKKPNDLDLYLAMARGAQQGEQTLAAMEMTKWFDTNYHYIVPEIEKDQTYRLASTKVVDEFIEAKEAGIHTRPVLLGPISYLLLSKSVSPDYAPLDTLLRLLPVYVEVHIPSLCANPQQATPQTDVNYLPVRRSRLPPSSGFLQPSAIDYMRLCKPR